MSKERAVESIYNFLRNVLVEAIEYVLSTILP